MNDLVVVGGGSGGVRAARIAAELGAKVVLVEGAELGGTCVNRGCVPKKLLAYGAAVSDALAQAGPYGWRVGDVAFDWATLIGNTQAEVRRLVGAYAGTLARAGVEVVTGWARVVGPHAVEVDGRRIDARTLLIATGGAPRLPDVDGAGLTWTSDDIFRLERLPRRVVVLGAGYIGVEMASILRGVGCEVVLAHRAHLPLRGFDDDIRAHLATELSRRGIVCRAGTTVTRVEPGLRVTLSTGEVIEADGVLAAIGRHPLTDLGLEEVGVALGPGGGVIVDDHFRSSVPSIYAVGDVIDRVLLTPAAIAQGQQVARALFGGPSGGWDGALVPTAVFTSPPIGTVGLTEAEARARGAVRVYKTTFRPMKATVAGSQERTLMKLVVDDPTDKVLGVHIVGTDAPEMLQGFAVALTCGATKAQLDATLAIHPTAAEELVTLKTPVP